ncbi:MAG: hypothetical protein CVU06_11070, partial [Bacteroidetes bacterium HGW-Bacteroidetes-22]
ALFGFAVGEMGTILRTIDGGLNWETMNSGTTETLYHVDVLDADKIIVCGSNSTVVRSLDGGTTWSVSTIQGTMGYYVDMYGLAINPATGVGYICGMEQNIHKTTDFGLTWTPIREGYYGALYNVQMFGDDTCAIVGKNSIFTSLIARTFDGGVNWTWRDFYPVDGNGMSWETSTRDAHFFNPDSAITVQIEELNATGFITCTLDWENKFWLANEHTDAYLECLDLKYNYGLAGGADINSGGVIYESPDNGVNWFISETSGKIPAIHDVYVGANTLFAVGDGGVILTRDKFVGVGSPDAENTSVILSPNPASGNTVLRFTLMEPQKVTVSIIDETGRIVCNPVCSRTFSEGDHQISIPFNGIRPGTYCVLVTSGNDRIAKKLMVVR